VTVAVVFPGQGSQNKSMLDTFQESKIFNDVIDEGSDILGYEIKKVITEDDKINHTIYTQPLVLSVSYAMWKTLSNEIDLNVSIGAGHSLGEYTALVANGTFQYKEGLQLVKKRAELMSNAMTNINGAMAAVIGIDGVKVDQVCKEISKNSAVVEAVNYNCPGQTVIAGHSSAIDDITPALKNAGAKIVKKLPVSLAAHTSLLKDVAEQLKDELKNIKLSSSSFDVIHNFDLSQGQTGLNLCEVLSKQVCSPVRWIETMEKFKLNNITDVIEIGPGSVLSGLIKRFDKSMNLYSTKTIEDIKLTSQAL
jgi:[acyl-carrier-protein] S-malonyltransferase